ncbi:hypothetical protein MKEN_01227000 [Mycena kentingensis (nom. inval.)]|nr:hypothetical protein MKEN_01227000 [Mycena kentingensis (nom. inval.)]
MQPASDTKHHKLIHCTLGKYSFNLIQRDEHGVSNGTTLWLGGQILCAYLLSVKLGGARVIEFGSGTGLTALCLAQLGCTVVATDLPWVIDKCLAQNIASNSHAPGTVLVRQLDWTVPPTRWLWDHPTIIASPEHIPETEQRLATPFSLIVSADTIYSADLISPLLRSIHAVVHAAGSSSSRFPTVLICLERRDPLLVDQALKEATDAWGLTVTRVPATKIAKAVEKTLKWDRSEWEGVEIYKLVTRLNKQ